MKHVSLKLRRKSPRVKITPNILERLTAKYPGRSAPELVKISGLPYALVYNVLNGRVHSLSARHYRMLFKEPPPHQSRTKVDGTYFRKLVDLWIYLNGSASKADLYHEIFSDDAHRKVDYRIFSGQTGTIDSRLERFMEDKFLQSGIDQATIERWVLEHEQLNREERIEYGKLRPTLRYLSREMGIHPTAVLNQLVDRYETGELKTVSKKIYDRARLLKKSAQKALMSGDRQAIERIKETVYGKKKGYVSYADVEEEIKFLQRYAKKSPKRYLGRGVHVYEKGACKRIASWRAAAIYKGCDAFIESRTDLPIVCLPKSYRNRILQNLQSVLLSRAADILTWSDGIALEKKILSPTRSRTEYIKFEYGFTQFDRAPHALGMKKRAFDLMVAKHCDIFKIVGKYASRWYVSDLYLKELAGNACFNVVSAKYERMAKLLDGPAPVNQCIS